MCSPYFVILLHFVILGFGLLYHECGFFKSIKKLPHTGEFFIESCNSEALDVAVYKWLEISARDISPCKYSCAQNVYPLVVGLALLLIEDAYGEPFFLVEFFDRFYLIVGFVAGLFEFDYSLSKPVVGVCSVKRHTGLVDVHSRKPVVGDSFFHELSQVWLITCKPPRDKGSPCGQGECKWVELCLKHSCWS